MPERYKFTLSQELLEKAATELNEPRDNEERCAAIDQLRNSYNESGKNGPLFREDDGFILQFLRAKKFDQAKSLTMMKNYHKVRTDYKQVFSKMANPVLLKQVIESGAFLVLDGETKQGAKCLFCRVGLFDPTADPLELTACTILIMEKLLENEQFQICGLEVIEDMENFNMLMMAKITPGLSKMKAALQEAMPVRMRSIHIVNEGTIFDMLMAIIRPFMRKKILDRIHVYGSKYCLIHDHVDKAILPPCLDGTGPETKELERKWIELLTEDYTQDTAL